MKVTVGAVYQHYKNKKYYTIIALGRDSDTLRDVVIYQGEYDDAEFGVRPVWVRPYAEFVGMVTWEGNTVPRFTLCDDPSKNI
jgi:hypothetical protein